MKETKSGLGGRPKLDGKKVKKSFPIRLSEAEIAELKKGHEGLTIPFRTYLRQRLLATKTITFTPSLDPAIRNDLTDLKKLIGAIQLLAFKVKGESQLVVSLQNSIEDIQAVTRRAYYSVTEKSEAVTCIPKAYQDLKSLFKSLESRLNPEEKRVAEGVLQRLYTLYENFQ